MAVAATAEVRDVSGDVAFVCARVDAKRTDCVRPALAEVREATALVHEEISCAMTEFQTKRGRTPKVAFLLKEMGSPPCTLR